MSTTELAQVEALLERLLPDPEGFVERVFQQMVDRLSAGVPRNDSPSVVARDETTAYQALADRNALLAAAVGACDCWGQKPDCPTCSGEGAAGWTKPDVRLYAEYVEPAVLRSKSAGHNRASRHPTEGEYE